MSSGNNFHAISGSYAASGQYDAALAASHSHMAPSYTGGRAVPSYSTQVVGRAVPSYSTHIVGAAVPTYSTQVFNSAPVHRTYTHAAAPSFAEAPHTFTMAAPRARAQAPAVSSYGSALASAPVVHQQHSFSPVGSFVAASPVGGVPLNQDPNPILIRKKPAEPVRYTQEVSVKFLQPPPPQQPGDIVITQQKDVQAAPAPPHLIRQRPPLPVKPAPLVVRERPPVPPAPIAPEHHVIPGKVIPPPPRKVITERLPQLPQPPQDIIVERWLEYGPRTRRVVFHPAPKLIPAPAPKNVIIQWDSPAVALNRQFRNLGVAAAHPAQYAARFGASLVESAAIPAISRGIRPDNGLALAAESLPKPVRLVGDVAALSLINRAPAASILAAPAVTLIAEETASFVNAPSHSAVLSNSAAVLSNGLAAGSGFINASGSAYYDF